MCLFVPLRYVPLSGSFLNASPCWHVEQELSLPQFSSTQGIFPHPARNARLLLHYCYIVSAGRVIDFVCRWRMALACRSLAVHRTLIHMLPGKLHLLMWFVSPDERVILQAGGERPGLAALHSAQGFFPHPGRKSASIAMICVSA